MLAEHATIGIDKATLKRCVGHAGRVVRVLIAGHAGSTPREAGTSMIVWEGGQSGTIGGGALEFEAAKRARAMLRETDTASQTLKLPLGPALGQCCGGHVTLVLERFDAEGVTAIPDEGHHARPIGNASRTSPGWAKALDPGQILPAPIFRDGWLAEPLRAAATPVWLYGAGHVGRAIVTVIGGLPFDVTWIDTGPDRFPDPVPPHATRLVAQAPQAVVAHAPPDAIHLVMTYSHDIDLEVCHAVLGRPFGQLGLIGSATKKIRFLKRLADLGHKPEALERLICPIGARDLGKHPQAIAVGVVSALLRAKAAESVAIYGGKSA